MERHDRHVMGELLEVLKEFMPKEKFMETFTEEIYLSKTKKFPQTLALVTVHVIMMRMKVQIKSMEFYHILRRKFYVAKVIMPHPMYILLVLL